MKKSLLLALSIFSLSALLAQSNAVKIQIGYGLPLAGQTVGDRSVQDYSGASPTYTRSFTKGSFGSGTQIGVGYARSISGLLSVQLDATYLIGKSYDTYQFDQINSGTHNPSAVSNQANFFQISPQIRAKFGDGKFSPYAAIGPIIGFGKMYEKGYYGDYDSTPYSYELTYSGSASVGAKTTVGLEMTQGKLGYFAQITMINMNYAPTKGVYTKYILGGQDNLPNMTTNQKEFSYVDSYDQYAQQDPNQPQKQSKQYLPFSSLSLNFGVMYRF